MFALLCAFAQGVKAQITNPFAYDDVWNGSTTTRPQFYSTYEGKSNVFVINTAAELVWIRNNWDEPSGEVDGKDYYQLNYYLNANLDMNWSVCWIPLGGYPGETDEFDGEFYGNGHTIRIHIWGTDANYQGLFYGIDGKVENLHVAGTITSNQRHVAGLVGFASGNNRIEGCAVTATLNVSTDYAGGIVGHGLNSNTTVEGCVFAGTMNVLGSNNPSVGVIWGWSDSGTPTLVNCLEAGTYTGVSKMHPMGLQKDAGTITNCYYVNAQKGSPSNVCTVSGATQVVAATTAPTNLSGLVKDYGVVKAYQNGILFDGKFYVAPASISLADNSDNTTTISNAEGSMADVTLQGRTLYKDGKWNTICLPFNVTQAGSPLEGAEARPLTNASISGNQRVRFIGTYKSTAFDATDNSILLMGGNNTLYYPTTGAGIGAQRAYFKIGDGTALARLTNFNIDFGDGETTTGIISIENGQLTIDNSAGGWYSLDGRRLDSKPTKKGVYINNGKKTVIK